MAAGLAATARPARAAGDALLPRVALLAALAVFAAYQLMAFAQAGVFEYPLDDVYIHLAMAEGIAAGGYGINPGEYAAADSSPLYPFLLVPFAGTEAQRWLPLIWNLLGLAASAWLWGRIVGLWGLSRGWGLVLAAGGPVALNMPGVAFLGMEHSLHVAGVLATFLGLLRVAEGGRAGALLALGVVLMPAMRIEGTAFALFAAIAVFVQGQRRAGLLLAALALLPVLALIGGLTALGLGPLPGSVSAKLNHPDTYTLNTLQRLVFPAAQNLMAPGGRLLAGVLLLLSVLSVATGQLRGRHGPLLTAVLAAGWAHLFLGRVGWMQRYEQYAIVMLAAGALVIGARAGQGWRGTWPALAVTAAAGASYLPLAVLEYPANPDVIRRQHGEMARLAQDFVKGPVAVNDIGRVAWANDQPVLDLWGLASDAARAARIGQAPGWAGPLVRDAGARAIMIYDHWIDEGIDPAWVPLGQLVTPFASAFVGGPAVRIYAPDAAQAPALRALLAQWAQGLPAGAEFRPQGAAP